MERIITDDGTPTFMNAIGETYHSKTGAKEEAIKKFAEPALHEVKKKEVRALDVCFGLGYNSAALIDLFEGCTLGIVGIENDPEILAQIQSIDNQTFDSYHIIKAVAAQQTPDHLRHITTYYKDKSVDILLMQEDFRTVLPRLPANSIDIVLFDPFSPQKVPELWTESIFAELFRICKKDAVLVTYSCASSARANMTKVGFTVKDGPSVGRRSPSTIATKTTH